MNHCNSIRILTNTHSNLNLSDQTKFRLNEINKIKIYFKFKIQERKTKRKRLSKYIAAFDYINNTLFYQQQVEYKVLFLLNVLLEFLEE